MLTPEQIAARLHDRFGLLVAGSRTAPRRHQSLSAVLEWSYDLLSEDERAVFSRLAVFASVFSLEAAEAVCADDDPSSGNGLTGPATERIETIAVLDLLTRLVDKSLVVADPVGTREGRFRLLDTIRHFAWDRLVARGELTPTRDRHARHFLALAEQHSTHLASARQLEALRALEREHDDLRAAAHWLLEQHDRDRGPRLAAALSTFWHAHAHLDEGRRLTTDFLHLTDNTVASSIRARLLTGAGRLASAQTDYANAQQLIEQALGMWRDLGEYNGLAYALRSLAETVAFRGDLIYALRLATDAVAASRAAGDRIGEAEGIWLAAHVAYERADLSSAQQLADLALNLCRELRSEHGIMQSLATLGRVSRDRGDNVSARVAWNEALALAREQGDRLWIARLTTALSSLEIQQLQLPAARALLVESLTLRRELGDREGIAWCIEGLVELAAAEQQAERALNLAGASMALRARLSAPRTAARTGLDRAVAWACQELGSGADRAWAAGRLLSIDEAIALAMQS